MKIPVGIVWRFCGSTAGFYLVENKGMQPMEQHRYLDNESLIFIPCVGHKRLGEWTPRGACTITLIPSSCNIDRRSAAVVPSRTAFGGRSRSICTRPRRNRVPRHEPAGLLADLAELT